MQAGFMKCAMMWLLDLPYMQPLTGEAIVPTFANRRDDAIADIHARGFWGRQQGAFLPIRVFHPNGRF